MAISAKYNGRPADRAGIAVVCLALGFGFGWVFWRLARVRFMVGSDSVTVVNPLRTYSVPRSDVRRIEVDSGGSWAYLVCRSEQRIPVYALSSGFRWTFRRRMEALNTALGFDRT